MSTTSIPTGSPTIDWRDLHNVNTSYEPEPLGFRPTNSNAISCLASGEEMLRVTPEGFWVRGKKVEQDDNEAQIVYNAFKAWMAWAQLNRDYK